MSGAIIGGKVKATLTLTFEGREPITLKLEHVTKISTRPMIVDSVPTGELEVTIVGERTTGEHANPSYEELLAVMRKYVEDQITWGNPATLDDLRQFRIWKNMPQNPAYDEQLLREIGGMNGRSPLA